VYTLLKSSLWRYFAEFVGTFILVLFGDGAIVASTLTGQPNFGFIMVSWAEYFLTLIEIFLYSFIAS